MRFGDVGARIKEKRKEKKLTQAQLANAIGKTESSIRKYEKNLVEIPSEVMNRIAIALDTSVSYLDGIDMIQTDVKKIKALSTLLEEQGFSVIIAESRDTCGKIQFRSALIGYKDKTITLDTKDLDVFEQDIYKYIKFRMLELLKQQD